ncbi:hypothetical protein JX265_013422 [Neoarthrinium moseri]|uniref:Uncharacterized protein n=1 Tax=Neoarthrinium moseri TaxID=1658444 RepID=A0A9P9W8P9_9PEZI|nr:hypothetical protein JX265_013422 [Neoarthrinium moseri]
MVNLCVNRIKATKEDTGIIREDVGEIKQDTGYLDSLTTYAATVYDDLPDENADQSDSNTERGYNISVTEKQTEHLDYMMGKTVSPDEVQHTLSQQSLDQIHSDRGQKSNSPLSIDPQSDARTHDPSNSSIGAHHRPAEGRHTGRNQNQQISADTAVDRPPTKEENGREAIAIVDSQVNGPTQGKRDPATSSQIMPKISQGNVSGKNSGKAADLGMIDLRVADVLSNINIQVRHLTCFPRILDDIYTFGVSEDGEHVATLQTDRRICV